MSIAPSRKTISPSPDFPGCTLDKTLLGALKAADTFLLHVGALGLSPLGPLEKEPGTRDYQARFIGHSQVTLVRKVPQPKSGWKLPSSVCSFDADRRELQFDITTIVSAWESTLYDSQPGYPTRTALDVRGAFVSRDYLKQDREWKGFVKTLRAGDHVHIEICADNNSETLNTAGLHRDEALLVVRRTLPSLKTDEWAFTLAVEVCPNNTARMVRGTYRHGDVFRSPDENRAMDRAIREKDARDLISRAYGCGPDQVHFDGDIVTWPATNFLEADRGCYYTADIYNVTEDDINGPHSWCEMHEPEVEDAA